MAEQEGKPEVWGDGCECWVVPEHLWTTHYGAVEPGSMVEWNPDCPLHPGESVEVPAEVPDRVPRNCGCFPHGPDEPCTCDGCWACEGHVVGCTCDIAWDCEHGREDV